MTLSQQSSSHRDPPPSWDPTNCPMTPDTPARPLARWRPREALLSPCLTAVVEFQALTGWPLAADSEAQESTLTPPCSWGPRPKKTRRGRASPNPSQSKVDAVPLGWRPPPLQAWRPVSTKPHAHSFLWWLTWCHRCSFTPRGLIHPGPGGVGGINVLAAWRPSLPTYLPSPSATGVSLPWPDYSSGGWLPPRVSCFSAGLSSTHPALPRAAAAPAAGQKCGLPGSRQSR